LLVMVKKQVLRPCRGMRDFYPDQMVIRQWLFEKMRVAARLFGYQEYDGPALEPLALYAAKSGEELVKKQTFILQDRSGQRLALRPELTPTLARMVAQKQGQLNMPLRWSSIGPRWRYERPQKGRTREFYQWDVDLIGVDSSEADAEVIAIAVELLRSVGFSAEQVVVKVNNRRFLEQKLNFIEVPKSKIQVIFSAIDKKDKMSDKDWKEYLKEIGLNELQIEDLRGILKDNDFSGESDELTNLFSTLKDLGVADYVEFDPTVVRGLDYYTGTVFEARDRGGEFRAILGGGRYDNLVEVVGGQKVTGVGFACGDVVIEEVLRKFNLWPNLSPTPTKVLVTVLDDSCYRASLQFASRLRKSQIATELYLAPSKLNKQLKYADKKGITWVVILGPKEIANKAVTLKSLKTGQQETIPQNKAIKKLARLSCGKISL